jgi:arylsulfatase A-like enzyme
MRFTSAMSCLGALALAACGTDAGPDDAGSAGRGGGAPSVILISLDTVRADHLSPYGYERDTTPNLAALAAEGLVVENFYSTAPWTLTAHMSMLTGLFPEQHGIVEKSLALADANPTLAERLQAAGYQTAGFYRDIWVHPRHGFDRGFELFVDHENAAEASAHLAEFLEQGRDEQRPLFLFLHLFDAHTVPLEPGSRFIYEPPAEFRERFQPGVEALFPPGRGPAIWEDPRTATAQELEGLRALYDGGLSYVDDVVGGWIEDWRASGLLDESILMVTADHGESLGQRDGVLMGHGGMFAEGLRVPLILRLPGGERAGERLRGPFGHVDLVPTLLGFAGLDVDDYLPGVDLLSHAPDGSRVFSARWGPDTAYLRWPDKIVQTTSSKRPRYVSNLEQDPGDLEPRTRSEDARGFDALFAELEAAFAAQLAPLELPGPEPQRAQRMDAVERERLEALGYTDE